MIAFALLGMLKARYVLARSASKASRRIESRGDGKCLGGFFSARSWLLVALMAGSGRLLRAFVARGIVGLVYLAVGVALMASSLVFWKAYGTQGDGAS